MFTVTETGSESAVILLCSGRLDHSGGIVLEDAMAPLLAAKAREVTLDLSEVNYLSSAGVRSLLVALKKAKLGGGQLSLRGVAGHIEQVLQLSGLRSLFPISVEAE